MILAFHKPWGVLSQFTEELPGQRTLAEFGFPKNVWPIGRLDRDSEGLILLSDERQWTDALLNPRRQHPRSYTVQVEHLVEPAALEMLRHGVVIEGRRTLPCKARLLPNEPAFPPRDPPIRVRLAIPTCWIELELVEGRNRQVRKMTASVGHPTLRLVRTRIGDFPLGELAAGKWQELGAAERKLLMS